jgi:hypothetical protein
MRGWNEQMTSDELAVPLIRLARLAIGISAGMLFSLFRKLLYIINK